MNLSCYAGEMHGLPSMFLNDNILNVTSTVTHVMEFTEECLTVFGLVVMHCYPFIFGYLVKRSR